MEEQPHKRRVRYAGTHPRHYSEKYKELQPEKYADTVAHVIEKGGTPAGMHIPICVDEILSFLQVQPGQKGVDATLGYGGHSGRILQCLEGQGHLYSLDVDPIESAKTRERLRAQGYGEEIFTVLLKNFAKIDEVAAEYGPFHFFLADLGVSSMQIDNPERGFSYKLDGPLDLRMNPRQGVSAAQRLRELDKAEFAGMLIENADEPYAQEIARSVYRKGRKIETTTDLRRAVEEALPRGSAEDLRKACQRTFQALRIDVNHEYEVLYELLEKLPEAMLPGGRIAILTFHSGEDRLVKKSFKQYLKQGVYQAVADEVIRPSAAECARNPRARSAKLRWAIKA